MGWLLRVGLGACRARFLGGEEAGRGCGYGSCWSFLFVEGGLGLRGRLERIFGVEFLFGFVGNVFGDVFVYLILRWFVILLVSLQEALQRAPLHLVIKQPLV